MAGNVLPLPASLAYLEGKAAGEVQALVSGHFGLAARAGGGVDIKRPRGPALKPHPLPITGALNSRFVPEGMAVLSGSRALLPCPLPKPTFFIQADVEWSTFSHGPLGSPRQSLHKNKHSTGSVQAGITNGSTDHVSSRRCIVLDIEGTTTPITFVTDVLFPYARDNVRKHLVATYDSEETKEDIKLLRAQVEEDLKNGVMGAVPAPPDDAGKEEVINSLVTNVEAMIQADRKITSLKQLQGHIWRTGFESKELQAVVYEDVPEALHRWHANGIKVYIYSSGSREAQRLIFGNTTHGDLRNYLCGFFDTMVGNKREPKSYFEIYQSLGVDKPSQILFVTDVYQEAVAAKAAGLEVAISVRPGNAPLPENHGFATISSFAEI